MKRYAMAFLLLTGAVSFAQGYVKVPVGGGPDGIEGLRWVPMGAVTASVDREERADGERPALKVTFTKDGTERRLLALESPAQGNATGSKALAVRYRLRMDRGALPHLALVVHEKGGGVWFKVAVRALEAGEFTEARLALSALKPAEFSADPNGELQWDQVEKLWLACTVDGPAAGSIELSSAFLTNEPFRPTQPLRIALDGSPWQVSKDPAAEGQATVRTDGPGGAPCMAFEFSFPGGRHMYDIPSLTLPEADLDGYRALQFAYKADLPKGIGGLLVMLREGNGAQYCATPPPPASKEWKTVTIPLDAFKLGGWSKDENAKLEMDQVRAVCIGLHGTASDSRASGSIMAKDIQFMP